ncbi:transposase [Ruminococcus sp.]|uniref:transposase n=1 Tax=Ruminococcus sp. TaxID=41978 RepID=UPI002873BF12|nr:transposase [Ruminococcus sp.]
MDAVIQKSRKWNEHRALCDMVDRYDSPIPSVFIADRGYESYNNMAHIQQIGQFFLFRIKDINGHGILRGFDLPDDNEFDLSVSLTLTNKQSKLTKSLCKDRNHFRFVPSSSTFDFLPVKSKYAEPPSFFNLAFRIVRVEVIPGKYEVLITNLPVVSFPPEKIKFLYSLRWGIEISFRSLKYTVGLLYFHSKEHSSHSLPEKQAKITSFQTCHQLPLQSSITAYVFQCFFQADTSLVLLLCLLYKNTAEIFISTAFLTVIPLLT